MNKRCLYIISSLLVGISQAMKIEQIKFPASLQSLCAIALAQKISNNIYDQAHVFKKLHNDLRFYLKSHLILFKNKINPIKTPKQALQCAAEYNLHNLIDELLDSGGGVAIDITFGFKLLDVATYFDSQKVTKKLLMILEEKYDEKVIANLLTSSDVLLQAQSPEVADLLVSYGADQKKDLIAAKAIESHMAKGRTSMVKWWLPYRKYKIEHRLEEAVKHAIALRHEGKALDEQENALEMVKTFLENGAQVNRSNWSKPLLQQAQEAKHPALIKLLRSYQNQ